MPSQDNYKTRTHRPDYWLVVTTAILLAIGLMLIYSISPALTDTTGVSGSYYVARQILAIFLAIVAFLFTAFLPLSRWRQYRKWLIAGAALATLVAIVLPVNPNYPAHRWVRLGGLSFESVEMLIFAFLIWMADFLAVKMAKGEIKDFRKVIKPLLGALVIIGVVVAMIQSDLGSTAVIVAMMGVMVFVAGLPLRRLLMIGVVIVIGAVLAIIAMPYRLARVETFLHPTANCQTTGYQACQAIIAVGSGGATGLGLGSGVQAYGYLPEADNDSIFAIFAEKFGFIGSIILLAIFCVLFYRIARIAETAPDNFSRLIVVGVLVWISVEALINIGAMVGLLPLKGITLPFVSYGGTSVVFFAAAIGLVYQISGYTMLTPSRTRNRLMERLNTDDNSSHGRRIGRTYRTGSGGRS